MSISNKAIRKQFRTKLVSVPGIPGAGNRAWENINFAPTEGTPWIRETLIPGDERLSANDEVEATGFCQIDYFVPIGSGTFAAQNVADAIKNAFKPATVLGGLVRIQRSVVLSGRRGVSDLKDESSSSPWYQVPVQIDYIVFSQNQ